MLILGACSWSIFHCIIVPYCRIRVLLLLLGRFEVLLMRVNQGLKRNPHVLGQVLPGGVELHHSSPSVVLGLSPSTTNYSMQNSEYL